MIKKSYLIILKLFKCKWKFKKPPQKKIIIYDHGEDHLDFLNMDHCFIFFARWEEINVFALTKAIFRYGFDNLKHNYEITLFEIVNPKFIISFRCDNRNFYLLKKYFKKSQTIFIQWGKTINGYLRHNKEKNENFFVDQMYLFGEETAKEFSKFIKGNTYSIGSMPNNKLIFTQKIKKNTLIFISQFKPDRKLPNIEKLILSFLKDYCQKNQIYLRISTRVLNSNIDGKKVYEEILGKSGWDYLPRKSFGPEGDYEAYKEVMLSEYVVSIDSTLGYEALSRKKKIAFFNLGSTSEEWSKKNYILNEKASEFHQPTPFGFPLSLPSEGEFWTSFFNLKKMSEILDFLRGISHEDWLKLLEKYKTEKIIEFDENNKTLINNLKKTGVPLRLDL